LKTYPLDFNFPACSFPYSSVPPRAGAIPITVSFPTPSTFLLLLFLLPNIWVPPMWFDIIVTLFPPDPKEGLTMVTIPVFALSTTLVSATGLPKRCFFETFPFRRPERLVELSSVRRDGKIPFSYPTFRCYLRCLRCRLP
jgi:hypothetical protein